jgi:hypothetical protein
MTTGGCLSCFEGFSLSNNKCVVATVAIIPQCLTASSTGICLACLDGYYLVNNSCKSVSITCATYNRQTGACTSCINGYFFQNDECIFPAFGIDLACEFYLNGYCSRCVRGYYLSNYVCVEVNRFCLEFDYNSNTCTKCSNKIPQGAECL